MSAEKKAEFAAKKIAGEQDMIARILNLKERPEYDIMKKTLTLARGNVYLVRAGLPPYGYGGREVSQEVSTNLAEWVFSGKSLSDDTKKSIFGNNSMSLQAALKAKEATADTTRDAAEAAAMQINQAAEARAAAARVTERIETETAAAEARAAAARVTERIETETAAAEARAAAARVTERIEMENAPEPMDQSVSKKRDAEDRMQALEEEYEKRKKFLVERGEKIDRLTSPQVSEANQLIDLALGFDFNMGHRERADFALYVAENFVGRMSDREIMAWIQGQARAGMDDVAKPPNAPAPEAMRVQTLSGNDDLDNDPEDLDLPTVAEAEEMLELAQPVSESEIDEVLRMSRKRGKEEAARGNPVKSMKMLESELMDLFRERGIESAAGFLDGLRDHLDETEKARMRKLLDDAVRKGKAAEQDFRRIEGRQKRLELEPASSFDSEASTVQYKRPSGIDLSGVADSVGNSGTAKQPPRISYASGTVGALVPKRGSEQVAETQHTTDTSMPDAAGMPAGGEKHEDYTSDDFRGKSLAEIKEEILRDYPPDRAWYILRKLGLSTGTHDLRTYGMLNTGLTGEDLEANNYILNNGKVGPRPLNTYTRYAWKRSNEMVSGMPILPGTAQKITSKVQSYQEPVQNITPQYFKALGYRSSSVRSLRHGRR